MQTIPFNRSLLAAAMAAVLAAVGCSSGPRTERVTGDDMSSFVAPEAAAKFQAAHFFADRTTTSPKVVIATRRAEVLARNLQLTEAERWYLVDRVANAVPGAALRERNIAFVIPEEKARAMAAKDSTAAFPPDRKPTHVMTASVRAANRNEKTDHTALYIFEYKIENLSTGEVAWSDTVEYKRVGAGSTYD